ncbi:MAG: hypothetical protein F6K19_23135 [Cyanothece sp. SIO1E1]|nr:hypothetical protein [Cyanothece sp. SIO1E1]
MSRDALVVGINLYNYQRLNSLSSPANDAEAIADRLQSYGDFKVWRLPEFSDPFDGNARKVARNKEVTLEQLENALVKLFKPSGKHVPDTALFFFSGHGLRKNRGIQEGYLATSAVDPARGNWGLSLQWLRRLLQESPIKQQIVWLDCCYSGELLNFAEADPGNRGKGHDRCFIAASREYEAAYEETSSDYSVLTKVLLDALHPKNRPDELVTNFTLTSAIEQSKEFRTAIQRPLFANSGSKIILTGCKVEERYSVLEGICPFKGLAYFDCNDEDPKYFYGRDALTDVLLEKVRESNFLTVLGPSGSGKSSVVRAGLLNQLKLGQRLSDSHTWPIYILSPGEHPLESLARVFVAPDLSEVERADQIRKAQELISSGSLGLCQLINAFESNRVVLAIDQFEECFTLCRDVVERQQFFECLLKALERLDKKLCLIITMRADFLGKCLEQDYNGLSKKIEDNIVGITPMDRDELTQVIIEPAKQVGLEVENELVNQMLVDTEGESGSLPLLQYTLTELWKHRSVNWLTLATYNQLGGVRGTLQKRADKVYESLSQQERDVTRRVFLELTHLGDWASEDTRRRITKRELITSPQSEILIDRVIQKLSAERLVVTTEYVEKGTTPHRVEIIDVAHEALIRHWPRLRNWIKEARVALKQKRDLEEAAEEWFSIGKSNELAYLLQGPKLSEAENFIENQGNDFPVSHLAQEFIRVSQTERDRIQQRERLQQRLRIGSIAAFLILVATGGALFGVQQNRSRTTLETIFLAKNAEEISKNMPALLLEAQKLGQSTSEEKINKSLYYYQKIISVINTILKDTESEKINNKLGEIRGRAENDLSALIEKYRIPMIKQHLTNGEIGEILQNTAYTDFENRYPEGALKETYKILMMNTGVNADLNQDGKLNNSEEAAQIPCSLLLMIEKLWKDFNRKCGWHESFSEPPCVQGKVEGELFYDLTLTAAIFDYPDGTGHLASRFNVCQHLE